MRATSVFASLQVADLEAAKDFYTDYLGLSVEEFNLGSGVRRFFVRAPDGNVINIVNHRG